MMTISIERTFTNQITLAEFLEKPDTKPASEYIDGEILQKPMPQGEHSVLQSELLTDINRVGNPAKIVYAFPELRCVFGGKAIVPDIAVFASENIPRTREGQIANRFEMVPDWLIEILSPEQSVNKVIKKIVFSLKQGSQLAWLIDPDDQSVTVFYPQALPEVKEKEDLLPSLEALKDWRLSVTAMFAWLSF
jgi:Uma2 family endonuclease